MDINGRTALDILMQTWCENAETFQGFWPSRISTLALMQLFLSERPSLRNLTVKGDIIIRQESKNSEYLWSGVSDKLILVVIMTRSRTKTSMRILLLARPFIYHLKLSFFPAPHEFTAIPFPVKVLKIILHDVHSGGESATFSARGAADNVDSDDGVCFQVQVHVENTYWQYHARTMIGPRKSKELKMMNSPSCPTYWVQRAWPSITMRS